jgi:predicted MPP superfamily phosphohydrolase
MSLLGLSLFFAAWVGHSAIWLVALNVLYAQPVRRSVLRAARLLVGILVVVFPVALAVHSGIDLPNFPPLEWTGSSVPVAAYLFSTWFVALVIIPVVTISRQIRTTPPQLVSSKSEVVRHDGVDKAVHAGDGKYRRLALLPFNEVLQVEFAHQTLEIASLPPAWDGLTILQLSDLHFCGTPDSTFFQKVFDRCMADGTPDILVLSGDYVDSSSHHRWIMRLMSRLQWNEAAFAILGNHDQLYDVRKIRRRLSRCGFTVLGKSWHSQIVRGLPLIVVGHEGPWFEPPMDIYDAPEGVFRLCLSHTPDNIRWAQRNHIDLMLCGHCHGGQIRLPLFGSLFVPSKYSRRYDQGLYFEPPTLFYVNRGLSGKEPLRYLCRPEVTRFILRARKG